MISRTIGEAFGNRFEIFVGRKNKKVKSKYNLYKRVSGSEKLVPFQVVVGELIKLRAEGYFSTCVHHFPQQQPTNADCLPSS